MTVFRRAKASTEAPPPAVPGRGHNAPPAEDARLSAFEDLESQICDLSLMAGIASALFEALFEDVAAHRELNGGRADCYLIDGGTLEKVSFAISNTLTRAADLRASFYEAHATAR
ncbi:unknown protein [Azorhizobium caulinodans ORS 571]|uniref:Uncharacterized protein n=1 Tax=Azorhizobium caulinodans (strain ATCC 43989 / DSM 5975 / JCM 20966 / LMG 6465 / NBRC 14845 / NCIMB 13405 / ORS 571) TaxID=438753 RepID=A8HTT1_AZOC5|nr:hypothetical protein [Azorhizobium caulinodans]BAF86867.1 unknown protein [Azorhizobium caulinodans ORS 571]